MSDKKLTVCIPTYNRKERLLKQLDSLYIQPEVYDIEIVIIDNHSDYDVKGEIENHFGKDKIHNLTVLVNPVNFGLEPNICMPFLVTKTDWLWTLSDDDETLNNSISIVLDAISTKSENAFFNFSISSSLRHTDVQVNDVSDLIDYWCKQKLNVGDLVFLSNKVYNMRYVKPHIGEAFKNCFNAVGHIVPMLYCLNNQEGSLFLSSSQIVAYKEPDPNSRWSFLKIALAFSTVSYLDLNISKTHWKQLCGLLGSNFGNVRFIDECLNYKPRYKGKFIFLEVYNKILKNKGLVSRFSIVLFYFCWVFHINYRSKIPYMRKVRNKLLRHNH